VRRIGEEAKRRRGEEGKRGRGEEGKRGRGEEGQSRLDVAHFPLTITTGKLQVRKTL